MKRFGILAAGILLGFFVAGCESGIPEGPPKEGATGEAPAAFKEFMKENAAKMQPKPAQKYNAPKDTTGFTPEKK